MKSHQPAEDKSYLSFPKIPRTETTLLCEDDPDEIDEAKSDSWYRRFAVISLSEEEIMECMRRHALFVQHVGGHCDYDPASQQRNVGADSPSGEYSKYYDVAKTWPDMQLKSRTPIGWFEDSHL